MARNLILSGTFDVDAVRGWLDARPDAFEDPHGTGTYLIAGRPWAATRGWEQRTRDASKFPRAVYAHITPTQIALQQELGDADALRSALDFLRWIVATCAPAARIDGFGDVTDEIRAGGADSQYPEAVRAAPLPWRNELIELGFFRELAHGDPTGPSLALASRPAAGDDDEAIARYLEAGHLYRGADRLARDVGIRPHVLTDGVYAWPADLASRVRADHVRLPRHFRVHVRRNAWQVPAVDLVPLPGSPHAPRPTATELARLTRILASPPASGETCTLEVDDTVVLGRRLRAGPGDEVRTGYLTYSASPVLVTLTVRHSASYDALRDELALAVDGIAALRWLGAAPANGIPYDDVLVEDLPRGDSLPSRAPLPLSMVIQLGIDVAEVLARAHAEDLVVGFVPESIYIDGEGRLTALAPRGPRFVATSPPRAPGPRSYAVPYEGYETLALGKPATPARDVFALCATLVVAATGKHPFGATPPEIVQRVVTSTPAVLTGSPALDAAIAKGLAREPRPSADELATMLAAIR